MKRFFVIFTLLAGVLCADTFAPNDANLLPGFSPFNWEFSGASYARTINPGAYFKVNFTGTSFAVSVDVSALVSASTPSAKYPIVSWTIDGGTASTHQLLSTDSTVTLASGLADATHAIAVYLFATDSYSSNRWDGTMSLKVTGIVLDTGKTLAPATLRPGGKILFYGDSITEGAWITGAPNSPTYSLYTQYAASTLSYVKIVADALDCEYGQVAFGGQGYGATGNPDVPTFPATWNLIKAGVTRDFSGATMIVINMGTNGGVPSGYLNTLLTNLRALTPARLVAIVPFIGSGRAVIVADAATFNSANPANPAQVVDGGATASTISSANSWDGFHLNATGDQLEATLILSILSPPRLRPGNPVHRALLVR